LIFDRKMIKDIAYKIETQRYINFDKKEHIGKLILASYNNKIIGKTGYIEWEGYEEGKNTARMKIVGSKFDIIVDDPWRKVKVGSGLISRLIDQLIYDGFNQLLIIGALYSVKGFYDKSLGRLKEKGTIAFKSFERSISSIKDYVFDVEIKI